jgi:hypothetical protein
MDKQTLYYTLSTIPQVLAATSAIIGAFMFYRFSRITDFLIGDGQAAYDRALRGEPGYGELDIKYKKRLQDAISRKNIYEIGDVLRILRDEEVKADKEVEAGFAKKQRETGLRHIYEDRFLVTKKYYDSLKLWTKIIIGVSIFTILLSVISLSYIDFIIQCNDLLNIAMIVTVISFLITIVGSIILMIYALTDNTPYEKIKD